MAIFATLVACSDSNRQLAATPPDGVAYWAAAVISSDGTVRAASGLLERDAAVPFSVPTVEDGDSIIAFGFSAQQLSLFDLSDREALGQPLRPSSGCEPDLGPPEWEQPVQGPPRAAPRMTSDWLAGACRPISAPGSSGPLSLCGSEFCGQSWTQQGCTVELDLAGCSLADGLQRISLRLRPDGACAEEKLDCATRSAVEPARLAMECPISGQQCVMELFGASAPERQVDRVRLEDVSGTPELSWFHGRARLTKGYLTGLVVAGPTVFTVASDRFGDWIESQLSNPRLVGIDRRSLELVVDQALPSAVKPLLADPRSDGLIALRHVPDNDSYVVARYTSEGEEVASSTLSFSFAGSVEPNVIEMVYDAERDQLSFGVKGSDEPETPSAWVAQSLNVDTFEVEAECVFPGWSVQNLAIDGPRLLVSDDEIDGVRWAVLETCEHGVLGSLSLGSAAPGPVTVVESSEEVLFGLSGSEVSDGVYVLVEGQDLSAFAYYEALGFATAFASTRSGNRTEHWAAMTLAVPNRTTEVQARLVPVDQENLRFVPGSTDLGVGPVPELAADDDGVLWALLPWAGEIVRVQVP